MDTVEQMLISSRNDSIRSQPQMLLRAFILVYACPQSCDTQSSVDLHYYLFGKEIEAKTSFKNYAQHTDTHSLGCVCVRVHNECDELASKR